MVESRAQPEDEGGIAVDGFVFFVEDTLKQLTDMYGNIVVDYREYPWKCTFIIQFELLPSAC